jgi:hypothetical protein
MDTNKDDEVSLEEFQSYLDKRFAKRSSDLLDHHNRELRTRGDDILFGRGFCIFQTRREAYGESDWLFCN